MSFFDNLKKSMGIKSQPTTTGKGHVLGTANPPQAVSSSSSSQPQSKPSNNPSDVNVIIFERTFMEEKMGMGIQEYKEKLPIDYQPNAKVPNSRAYVQSVHPTSEAQKNVCPVLQEALVVQLGVLPNDVIIAVNGTDLTTFDDFFNFLAGMGRPVDVKFCRLQRTSHEASHKGSATSSSTGVTSIFKGFNLNNNNNSGNHNKSSSSQTALSEEEKRQRREMMSKAANERQWDKKVKSKTSTSTSSTSPRATTENTFDEQVTNPETLRLIQKTKEFETKVEKSMGYSPFQPHMSFTGNGMVNNGLSQPINAPNTTASVPLSTPFAAPGLVNPVNLPAMTEEETDLMIAEVDDAFAMLLSLGEEEQEVAKVAVQTVFKMLQNLFANKGDPKFRSIRLSNKAFQSKVASVCGAVELLIAAGYRYDPTGSEAVGSSPTTTGTGGNSTPGGTTIKNNRYSLEEELAALGNSMAAASPLPYFQRDGYLIHSMERKEEKKLEYTLSRLTELMDLQNQSL